MQHFLNRIRCDVKFCSRATNPENNGLTMMRDPRHLLWDILCSIRVQIYAVVLSLLTMFLLTQNAIAGEVIGVVNIMNTATSQCLDGYWSYGKSGSDVKLYHCDGTSEQKWILEKMSYNTPYYNTGLIHIKNARYPNLCLDVKGNAYNKGNQIWLYNCWNHRDRRIETQLFDVTFSFYHTDYYSGQMSLGRISIENFFERGNSMLSTWIRPFFGGNLVFDIARGNTNGRVQLYPGHRNVMDENTRPAHLGANQLFSLVAVQ